MQKNELLNMYKELIDFNKLYNSNLIFCENQNDLMLIAKEISRMLFCKNNSLVNDNCEWCIKNDNNNIQSLIWIGDGNSPIKKVVANEIIAKFSMSNIEDTPHKLYIIANGENLSVGAGNALLKFLEEPPKNTYALILTNDKTQILSTIKSRCKYFILNSKSVSLEENLLINLIKKHDKNEILLLGSKYSKSNKQELVVMLEDCYKKLILKEYLGLSEIFIEAIMDIKNSNNYTLILENLFINISEGI